MDKKEQPVEITVWLQGQTNFTSLLLTLIQKADAKNLELLRIAFPRQVDIFETWINADQEDWKNQIGGPGS